MLLVRALLAAIPFVLVRAQGFAAPVPPNIAPSKVYDGVGRYQLAQDGDGRSIQGLKELAGRYGVKPYNALRSLPEDGTWQTERVVFHDVDSGATIVRLTNDPWANQLSYFRGNWSADGRYIVFRRRPGMWESSTATHGPTVVRSDGLQLRNAFHELSMVRKLVCSPSDPSLCYGMTGDNKLVAFDLASGKARQIVRVTKGCIHLKISLDGKYLMGRGELDRGGPGLWIVGVDGKEYHEIPVTEAIHDSYQFHPSQKAIMFWYEERYRKEGFVQCDFDGKRITKVPVQFDWNHGDVGYDRGVHTDGYITRIDGDAWRPKEPIFAKPGIEYYDIPLHYNGYLTWMPKDRPWVYATRIVAAPYLSEINAFSIEPSPEGAVNRYRICYTGLKPSSTLDNADASPDGTKVLFNSNMLGRVDIFYVVARLPDVPREVRAKMEANGVHLSWQVPQHHAEIAGYRVYRSSHSGYGYVPITDRPVEVADYTDAVSRLPGQPVFYAVSAIEYSGIESSLSREAVAAEKTESKDGKRTVFVEAEGGRCNAKMWVAFDGTAAGLHYLWMRSHDDKGHDGDGTAAIDLDLPSTNRPYFVWARVKGEPAAQFQLAVGKKSVSLNVPRAPAWTWKRFAGTVVPAAEKSTAMLSSRQFGSAIDCLALTEDADFHPEKSPPILWPLQSVVQGLSATPKSPYTVELTWNLVVEPTFRHYNLYCGRKADFAVAQDTLVASPNAAGYYDWALKPGETVYYRVTRVDCGGNESPPSATVKVDMPPLKRELLEIAPAAQVKFQIPQAGTYVVWFKLQAGKQSGQYINLKMDNAPAVTWSCVFDGLGENAWFTYDQWGRFPLTEGTHTLSIENRTKHTLEKVLLTNDLSFKPDGHVTILTGW